MIDRKMLVNAMDNANINYDKLFDIITESKNIYSYIIAYHNETVLIFAIHLGLFVSWYKLEQVGRNLITNIEDDEFLRLFINELKADLEL